MAFAISLSYHSQEMLSVYLVLNNDLINPVKLTSSIQFLNDQTQTKLNNLNQSLSEYKRSHKYRTQNKQNLPQMPYKFDDGTPQQSDYPSYKPRLIYEKDFKVIEKMIFQFKSAYESKTLSLEELNAYHKNIHEIQYLITTFLRNTFDVLGKKEMVAMLRHCEFLIDDQNQKSKEILRLYQESEKKLLEKKSSNTQKITTTCQRCYSDIRKVNIQEIKDYLQNEYMGTLDRMILQAKMQINGQLFTQQQDQLFFRQLHNTLKKKHENIEFNNKSIQALINKITKEIADLNLMKKMAIQESKEIEDPNYAWMRNISNSLNELLRSSFKKKLPAFLESMVSMFEGHFVEKNRKHSAVVYVQTDNYEAVQINELKEKLIKLNSTRFKLENDLKWVEQQLELKDKEMVEHTQRLKQQVEESWSEVIAEKERNKRMQFTIDTLNKEIIVMKEDIGKKTEKEQWFKKKISRVEKEKLEIEIQNIKNSIVMEKEQSMSQLSDTSQSQHLSSSQHQRQTFKQGQNNDPTTKKPKRLISKLTIKESMSKLKAQNETDYLKHLDFLQQQIVTQCIKDNGREGILKQSSQHSLTLKMGLVEEEEREENDGGEGGNGQMGGCEEGYTDAERYEDDEGQVDQIEEKVQSERQNDETLESHQQAMFDDTVPSQYCMQVKRVNQLMEERLKHTKIMFPKRNSKKSQQQQFSKTYSKLSTQNQEKLRNQQNHSNPLMNSDSAFSSRKKLHFRSQTLLNNMKVKTSEGYYGDNTELEGEKGGDRQGRNKSKHLSSARNLGGIMQGHDHNNVQRKSKRHKTIDPHRLNKDIDDLMKSIKQKMNSHKENHQQKDNQTLWQQNELKELITTFFSRYGIRARQPSPSTNPQPNQQTAQQSVKTATQKTMTNFQRKANKSVSFFKENEYVSIDHHNDADDSVNILKKPETQKRKLQFVEKKFPIVYKSCFNTPNMIPYTNGKAIGQKLGSDAVKRIIWKSLPDQAQDDVCSYIEKQSRSKYAAQNTRLSQIKNYGHKRSHTNQQLKRQQNIAAITRKSPLKVDIFTRQDFDLFLDQTNAYLYQCNHMKSRTKNTKFTLSPQVQSLIASLFSDIEQIKQHNIYFYQQIVSFIRYPYQTIKNINWGACIIKGLKEESFVKFMERIVSLHRKCPVVVGSGYCAHLNVFRRKIQTVKGQAGRVAGEK